MSDLLCSFTLDGDRFGVPADYVAEVVLHPEPTPVPLAAEHIVGLINLRGSVVCAIDLRQRFGREPGDSPVSVVVRHSWGTAALLVDDIDDVERVNADTFEPVPTTVGEQTRSLLTGVYRSGGQLIGVLDVDRVVKGDIQCARL